MSKAIALTRQARQASLANTADIARGAIVLACGAALILAGQPLPV